MYLIWLHNSDEIIHYINLFPFLFKIFHLYQSCEVSFLSESKFIHSLEYFIFCGYFCFCLCFVFGKSPNYTSQLYMNMNNVCTYVFLVLLILIYFFLQILSADCDTCIVIEIVGLLNIKIVYICLYGK